MELPTNLEGVRARRDLRSGALEIDVLGVACRVREWTWAERRRLVECAAASGRFDRARFLDGLAELLLEPRPPAELLPVFAHVALRLAGVRPGESSAWSLADAELELARTFGWPPVTIDEQPARALDRLLERSSAATRAPAGGSGWSRIVVDDA